MSAHPAEPHRSTPVASAGVAAVGLRSGAEAALLRLGNGLLRHPANLELRRRLADGAMLTPQDFYRQLICLLYRLIFLLVAEERGLIAPTSDGDRRWSHLLSPEPPDGSGPTDQHLFGLQLLPDLAGAQIAEGDLRDALDDLGHRRGHGAEQVRGAQRPTVPTTPPFAVEELSAAYEALLGRRPVIEPGQGGGPPGLTLAPGVERKLSGSYYTPPILVGELIAGALEPVLQARLRSGGGEAAILALRVVDPACGSGNLLVAAARHLGRALAELRRGALPPTPEQVSTATGEVIGRCIFGVDRDPTAAELCRLNLWIEGSLPGTPPGELRRQISVGNSLVGASRRLVAAGIPDGAYTPIVGDEAATARALRRRNAAERGPAGDDGRAHGAEGGSSDAAPSTGGRSESERAAVERARYDLWTAAFFEPLTDGAPAYTTATLRDPDPQSELAVRAARLVRAAGCFHWELELPLGFDVVLCNPPWERLTVQEHERLADLPEFASATNKAERGSVIAAWRAGDAGRRARIAELDRARRAAAAEARFARASGRFPLTGVGDVNCYALFAELCRDLLGPGGRAGLLLPTGVATDRSTSAFFASLVEGRQLVSLYDFENRAGLFPEVDSRYRFCLLTIGGGQETAALVCFATRPEQLHDQRRRFSLTATELALLSPVTRSCPSFRSSRDAALALRLHREVPPLRDARTGESPWRMRYLRMFDMAVDSTLFQREPADDRLPLYEGKMVQAFDHRAAAVRSRPENRRRAGQPVATPGGAYTDPSFVARPQYYVNLSEVHRRVDPATHRRGLLVYKSVSSPTNERSLIATWIPPAAAAHSLGVLLPGESSVLLQCCLLATLNALALDYLVRQKLGGINLSYYMLDQLPILPPERFSPQAIAHLVPRVLELVYTAWELQPFAQAVWDECRERNAACRGRTGSDDPTMVVLMTELLRRNTACNREAPREHFPATPGVRDAGSVVAALHSPFAMAPFRWDDGRRATARAELDARIARLYGLTRDELRYILDPAEVCGAEFPSETFRVLKEKEQRRHGEYRTRRLVLEAWDAEEAG